MSTLGGPELERRLGYHPATEVTAPMFELNRSAALLLAELFDQHLPPGREQAEAQTCLQAALMWANAAVACNAPTEAPVLDLATRLDDLLDRIEGPVQSRAAGARLDGSTLFDRLDAAARRSILDREGQR